MAKLNFKQSYYTPQAYQFIVVLLLINNYNSPLLMLIRSKLMKSFNPLLYIVFIQQNYFCIPTYFQDMNANSFHNSPINNSISKQLYSFSKANRFQKTFQSPCKKRFYDFNISSISKRATSLGYGNKIDLANKEHVPPPGVYQQPNFFSVNKNKKRGFSFGNDDNRSIINEQQITKIPGPGKYDTDKDVKFSHIKYSFRSKFQDALSKHQNNLGPGQYATLQIINKEGRHSIAKYQGSKCRKFDNGQRFEDIRAKTPGPGAYNDDAKLSMNKTGSYFCSRFRSNVSNHFGKSQRKPLGERTLSPGPGGYQTFSEFNSKTFR